VRLLVVRWGSLGLALLSLAACGSETPPGACDAALGCTSGACTNQVQDGNETGVDCGGACGACESASCLVGEDCASGSCVQGECTPPEGGGGSGGGQGGTSNGPDACLSECPEGAACSNGASCASGVCSAGVCANAGQLPDGGTECTANCPVGSACSAPETCASNVCNQGTCGSALTCGDTVLNGTETDTDCGGTSCASCAHNAACLVDTDCSSFHCIGQQCVVGPSAGFTLNASAGQAPLTVIPSSTATAGDAAIATTEYSFGDGGDFALTASHEYTSVGSYTVTQRVTDANGLSALATHLVQVSAAGFTPVLLSETDRSPYPLLALTPDRLGVEIIESDRSGVRSDRAIAAGSGMFYFEGERRTERLFEQYFGVATASLALDDYAGSSDQSLGADTSGSIYFADAYAGGFDSGATHYGFVVDYRGANPIVHIIANGDGEARIEQSIAMPAVTQPLYIVVGGRRREVGEQARINPGNDTTNFPFHYDPVAALNAASLDGSALVAGWGQTRAAPLDAAPNLSVSPPQTIALGSPFTLTATANDAEDGALSTTVQWADLATTYAEREINGDTNVGGSWTHTPRAVGIHPIQVSVRDSAGRVTSTIVDVTVTGTIPQFSPVQLVADDRGGVGVELRSDKLAAHWTANGKYGIRANQGMIGEFQYFEIHRLREPANQGGGLVIKEGNLAPYHNTDVPPSCSVNEFQSIWQDLISVQDYDVQNTSYYGFAVDYRERHPIVYVITHEGDPGTDVLAHEMELKDVTVPIYPLLYGNPQAPGPAYDAEMNFGATPFHYDPAAVLNAAGRNSAGLQVGWVGVSHYP
jgi:PKD repeat protein